MIAILATLIMAATPYDAKVIRIVDGDTIDVMKPDQTKKTRIRLDGIDSPEPKQPFGTFAKKTLGDLTFGKTVTVTPRTKDFFGRTVAQVKADGIDVNNRMVEMGAAWWYEQYAKRDTVKQQLQSDAQGHKRGLWADPHPMPPWDFRKKKPSLK